MRFRHFAAVPAQQAGAVQALLQTLAAHGLEQVIERPGLERADGVLVVGGHDDDHRQRSRRQAMDHVEAAQAGHLQIEQHQVGLQQGDLGQRFLAARCLARHGDIVEALQFLAQHLAGNRLVVNYQRSNRGHPNAG